MAPVNDPLTKALADLGTALSNTEYEMLTPTAAVESGDWHIVIRRKAPLRVWLAEEARFEESSVIIGVYSTVDKAKEACEGHADRALSWENEDQHWFADHLYAYPIEVER